MHWRTLQALALAGGIAPACARDPAEELCPASAAGDLVVTEVRGEQTGGDTWGQWIELHNPTGRALDLHGAVLDLRSITGGTRYRILVRRPLEVAPGGYVVIGDHPDDARPAHVDYGAGHDLAGTFPSAGGVTIAACGEVADTITFPTLPARGTWSLGLDPPTAAGNDDVAAWCADTTPSEDTTQLGLPGTPGAPNRPCDPP